MWDQYREGLEKVIEEKIHKGEPAGAKHTRKVRPTNVIDLVSCAESLRESGAANPSASAAGQPETKNARRLRAPRSRIGTMPRAPSPDPGGNLPTAMDCAAIGQA